MTARGGGALAVGVGCVGFHVLRPRGSGGPVAPVPREPRGTPVRTAEGESLMRRPLNVLLVLGAAATLAMAGGPLAAQAAGDGSVNVTSASPVFPFSQNKQNEPAIAVDANHNSIVAAGSNDEIDEQ